MASDSREVRVLANRMTILVPPRATKQRVVVTCSFGQANVRYSTTSEGRQASTKVDIWAKFPSAGVWDWILDENEGLWCITDVATVVGRIIKPMLDGSVK